MRKAWERELGAAVDELVAADTLAFGGVGIAGKLLPVTEAYQRVEAAIDDHPEEVRRQLDRVLPTAHPPAGRTRRRCWSGSTRRRPERPGRRCATTRASSPPSSAA